MHLFGNQLTSVPVDRIGQLTSLKVLCLKCWQPADEPAGGDRTARVALQYNQASVPAEIGQLTSLEKLDLQYNQLTRVPAEIGQLRSLEVLGLSYNHLTSLPAEIGTAHIAEGVAPQGQQADEPAG